MIKKIISNIKYIKISDLLSIFIFILMIIPSIIFRVINVIRKKKLILVTEDGYTARDNGYHFYKYIRTKHPNDYCFYVIDKKSDGYNNVKKYGNIIQYKSLKHWLYYMSAKYNISSQKYGNPNYVLFYFIHVILGLYKNRVFLQHGITKDNAEWLHYKKCKFKYFICGAKEEYEFVKENFGYPEDAVLYTGFARFDSLNKYKVNKKQILIMPTWRQWLGRKTNKLTKRINIKETEYFEKWNELLNDDSFIEYIEKEGLKVLFYPHMNMQKYLSSFSSKSKNIKILSMKEDIQKILKESSIMITDYSSVFMDFAYMEKPILFYQFDYDEFRSRQYAEGYYDYKKGFGPSINSKDKLIKEFIKIYENGVEDKYINRMNKFFELKDQNNCNRIYNAIINKKRLE